MSKETKQNDFIVTIFLLVIASICISSFIGYTFGIFDWLANNFDAFFKPYLNMGIWFYVVIIGMTVLYVYIVFGGKKVEEDAKTLEWEEGQ